MRTTDFPTHFAHVTGRALSEQDAEYVRQLFSRLEPDLTGSPSFIASLVVHYDQMAAFRRTVDGASEKFLTGVDAGAEKVLNRLVHDALKRHEASIPSNQKSFYRALIAVCALLVMCVFLTTLAIIGAQSQGWLVPNWLTAEAAAKVQWADGVERTAGRGAIDWSAPGDRNKILIDVERYLDARRTGNDPVILARQMRACDGPGYVLSKRKGKWICQIPVVR